MSQCFHKKMSSSMDECWCLQAKLPVYIPLPLPLAIESGLTIIWRLGDLRGVLSVGGLRPDAPWRELKVNPHASAAWTAAEVLMRGHLCGIARRFSALHKCTGSCAFGTSWSIGHRAGGGATPRFWTPTTPPTNCWPEAPWGGGGRGGIGGGGKGGAIGGGSRRGLGGGGLREGRLGGGGSRWGNLGVGGGGGTGSPYLPLPSL